jgi:hypothetical protein
MDCRRESGPVLLVPLLLVAVAGLSAAPSVQWAAVPLAMSGLG